MIKILENDRLFLLFFLLFGVIGLLANPIFGGILGFLLLGLGIYEVLIQKNKSGEAHLYIFVIGVFELFLRMSKGVSPHEISKYSIIILTSLGLFFTRKRRKPNGLGIIFILLFLPSLVMVDTQMYMWLEIILTTVLGPIGLGISLIYFFQYQINQIDIQNICRAIILPISSVLVLIQSRTIAFDEFSDLDFTSSNAALSGNFGPNQVSVVLGIAAGILLYCIFFGIKVFKYKILDYSLFAICVFRGLLTFSRGGITIPFIAFAIVVLISFIRLRNFDSLKKGFYIIIGVSFFYLIFQLTNSLTGSALEKRYSGETGLTQKTGERDVLSGRDQILLIDLEIFADNLLIGVGPGMAKPLRYYYGFANSVSAHIEFSRTLAEHGLLGVFAIILYLITIFLKRKNWKAFPNETFFLLFLFWIGFLNSNHNSFRLGITVFCMGIIVSKIQINPNYFSKNSQKKYFPIWEKWKKSIQTESDAAPKIAASEPANLLETSPTFPR